MGRMRLIEFHDQAWFPGILRDYVTEALELILNFGNLYKPIVPRLRKAFEDTDTRRVLDLCSGAGGPWLWLYRDFERDGLPALDICLTDKYPNAVSFNSARAASPSEIHFHRDPVDAMRIPDELSGFRTLFTSFHHFRPQEAQAILQDAVDKQQGIGIFEVAGRHFLTMLLVFVVPVADVVLVPFMRPFRWSRLLWTYLVPVVPLVLWFDGIVSCLRTYSPRELGELVRGISAREYQWEIGEERGGFLPVPVTYLVGYPGRDKLVTQESPSRLRGNPF